MFHLRTTSFTSQGSAAFLHENMVSHRDKVTGLTRSDPMLQIEATLYCVPVKQLELSCSGPMLVSSVTM